MPVMRLKRVLLYAAWADHVSAMVGRQIQRLNRERRSKAEPPGARDSSRTGRFLADLSSETDGILCLAIPIRFALN